MADLNGKFGTAAICSWEDSRFRKSAVRYVLDRLCANGGFCFYRLEEPNGSDTFYALSILKLLGYDFGDEKTVRYLQSMQNEDGSYDNIFKAFYSLQGLRIMNEMPLRDPARYIQRRIRPYDINLLPPEVASIFKQMFTVIELGAACNIRLDQETGSNVTGFVMRFRNDDGGFGFPHSTLIETAQALTILKHLNYPVESICGADSFIGRCETPLFGFVNVPRTSPSYLEYVHAGAMVSRILSRKPEYLNQCLEFIRACRNRNGGFSRASHAGIATMEDTYYGVHSVYLLTEFSAG
jgi:hypothetical protein